MIPAFTVNNPAIDERLIVADIVRYLRRHHKLRITEAQSIAFCAMVAILDEANGKRVTR